MSARLPSAAPAIVWFRDDLRLEDNPALNAAAASGRPLLCLYVHDETAGGSRPLGGAARWWLHGSLAALDASLTRTGGGLAILRGAAAEIVPAIVRETAAEAVFWNRRYDAPGRETDARLKATLRDAGVRAESFNGHLLWEPWTVTSRAGAPFRVFAAFWRAVRQLGEPPRPEPAPAALRCHAVPESVRARCVGLGDLALEPSSPDWAGGLREAWGRGEAAGRARLVEFVDAGLEDYAAARDRPGESATSRLSPYLRFGNLSARQVWHAATAQASGKFLEELGWREFSYHLLYHHPDLACRNLQPQFDAMPWRSDGTALRAWQRGLTGYPIVDAGMRELWATGWMHNRVRMIAASFLAKHLLIDWREGEAWFWNTLVDADPANNPASWQWVAGSGTDAAPYFRIFNPVLQGERFDPDGRYVRRWVPELAALPSQTIHQPWADTGRPLGRTYPSPIVDHGKARRRALAAWQAIRVAAAQPPDEL
ncbi:MAG TPA: deoxyribodipyrimidine photo-lyase [Stellaceae bacterium]|nr:deoxyribodipyrimidine photo-lyase [Stellaceae bacterium]